MSNVRPHKIVMDLEGVATFIVVLLHWRVLVCTVLAGTVGYFLVTEFSWFSATQGIVIACIGCGVGAVWHALNEEIRDRKRAAKNVTVMPLRKTALPTPAPTKPSTIVVAASLVGGVWGAASADNIQSGIAGGLVNAIMVPFWFKYGSRFVTVANFDEKHVRLSAVFACLSYSVAALTLHYTGAQHAA
jgi:hypothetical protein